MPTHIPTLYFSIHAVQHLPLAPVKWKSHSFCTLTSYQLCFDTFSGQLTHWLGPICTKRIAKSAPKISSGGYSCLPQLCLWPICHGCCRVEVVSVPWAMNWMFFRGDEHPKKFMKINGDVLDEGGIWLHKNNEAESTHRRRRWCPVKPPWLSLPGAQSLTPMQNPSALQLSPDTSVPVTGPRLLTLLAAADLHWGKA